MPLEGYKELISWEALIVYSCKWVVNEYTKALHVLLDLDDNQCSTFLVDNINDTPHDINKQDNINCFT